MAARPKRKRQAQAASSLPAPRPFSVGFGTASALLMIGVFLLYLGSYHYPPVFDDKVLNPVDLPNLTSFCMPVQHRCISYTSFGIQYRITGLEPLWLHLGNVLLHALTVIALFGFLERLFTTALGSDAAQAGRHRALALLGACLFAVHPVAVYGVAYLTQRSIVMATLFSLLSLTALLRALSGEGRSALWLSLSVLLYVAAMLSKEHAVMLPAVGLALAWMLGMPRAASGRERWIWAGAGAIILAIIAAALLSRRDVIGSVYEPYIRELSGLKEAGVSGLDPAQAYMVSLVTQAAMFFKYLLLWALPWPGWMSADMRQAIASSPFAWPHVFAFPAFLAYGVAAVLLLRRGGNRGLAGFALLFPWLLFFTEFATARIQEPFVLYRSYLWAPGILALLPLLARRLSLRAACLGGAVLAIALIFPMRERLATFQSNLALWTDVVDKNTDLSLLFVDRGYGNRAVALLREGRMEEAMRDLDLTLKLNPRSTHAYVNRGTIFSRQGELDKALADFAQAISLDPQFAEAHGEQCATLIKMNDDAGAMQACQRALDIAPWLPNARLNRAVLHARAMRMQAALDDLNEVIRQEPSHGVALYNRGMLYRQTGRDAEAAASLRAACQAGFGPACNAPR